MTWFMRRHVLPGLAFILLTVNVWTFVTRRADADRCVEQGHNATMHWVAPHPFGQLVLVGCTGPVP